MSVEAVCPNEAVFNYSEIKHSIEKRNDFLEFHKPFVAKAASKHCGRYLLWGRDEELSIALIALNQAIDAYRPETNVPFLAFARCIIERKLTDFFRKEKRHTHLPITLTDNDDISPGEITRAWEDYLETSLRRERAEEITIFSKLLAEYNISFKELELTCPKHKDSRELLTRTAFLLVQHENLVKKLLTKKQVPVKELAIICGLSPKTLEKSRKYIVATALLLYYQDEFLHLREFVQISKERRP